MKRILICLLILFAGVEVLLLINRMSHPPRTQSDQCTGPEQVKRLCFIRMVRTILKTNGVNAALETLSDVYEKDHSLSDVCHSLTHDIGAYAYEQFKQNKQFSVSTKFAICSYGFYHGFMERLAGEKNAALQAKQFCTFIDKAITQLTPDATLQCFHGIGHGFVNNHDPRTWGNEEKMIQPALSLCNTVAATREERSRCVTGVFNGIATFYNEKTYNLVPRVNDPFWICREQKSEDQDPCYISLNITLLQLTNGNIGQAAKFIEQIPDDTMARHAMINLAAPVGTKNIDNDTHQENIDACRQVQERLRIPCIQGYAFGFLEHGIPGHEYEKPLVFCSSNLLTADEKKACFEYILGYLPQWYPPEKVKTICGTVDKEYQHYCVTPHV